MEIPQDRSELLEIYSRAPIRRLYQFDGLTAFGPGGRLASQEVDTEGNSVLMGEVCRPMLSWHPNTCVRVLVAAVPGLDRHRAAKLIRGIADSIERDGIDEVAGLADKQISPTPLHDGPHAPGQEEAEASDGGFV